MRKTSLPRAIWNPRSSSSRPTLKHRAPVPRKPPYRITLLRTGSADAKAILARNNLAFDPVMESEGYILVIEPHDAAIVATTGAGVFYGVQTFKQLLPLPGAPRVLPTGTVRDWPAMRYRGINDDLSRGPFPTLEFQKHQIRVFASFKINIYSPYFEHTLLYPDHPLAAPPGSALTPAEAAELVAYARQYHVTIIPEQEAFGHLHHVLKWELYQDDGGDSARLRSGPRPARHAAAHQGLVYADRAGVSLALHPHRRRRNLRPGHGPHARKRSRSKATDRSMSISSSRFTTSSRP